MKIICDNQHIHLRICSSFELYISEGNDCSNRINTQCCRKPYCVKLFHGWTQNVSTRTALYWKRHETERTREIIKRPEAIQKMFVLRSNLSRSMSSRWLWQHYWCDWSGFNHSNASQNMKNSTRAKCKISLHYIHVVFVRVHCTDTLQTTLNEIIWWKFRNEDMKIQSMIQIYQI